jgi:hypothetical protein
MKDRLEKAERDKDQAFRDADTIRQQYLGLLESTAKVGLSNKADQEIANLIRANRFDEAAKLNKERIDNKEQQAESALRERANAYLVQAQLSAVQLDWPEAITWFQKAHTELPENLDAALGYVSALVHLSGDESSRAAELLASASRIQGAFGKKYDEHIEHISAGLRRPAELQANALKGVQIAVEMLKLVDSQGNVTDQKSYDDLKKQADEIAETNKVLEARLAEESASSTLQYQALTKERAEVQQQVAPLKSEANALEKSFQGRLDEAENALAQPLERLRQLAKTDLKTYGGTLMIALQDHLVIDGMKDREKAANADYIECVNLEIELARSDPKTEPIVVLMLEARRDAVVDAETDDGGASTFDDGRKFLLAVRKTYTPRLAQNPMYQVYVAMADAMLATDALTNDNYSEAETYALEALAHFAKAPAKLSGPLDIGNRELWIPTATSLLAMAEAHRDPDAAAKDFRKTMASLESLEQNDPKSYALELAYSLVEFAEFRANTGHDTEARDAFTKAVRLCDDAAARGETGASLAHAYWALHFFATQTKSLNGDKCALLAKAWAATNGQNTPLDAQIVNTQIVLAAYSLRSDKACPADILKDIPSYLFPGQ